MGDLHVVSQPFSGLAEWQVPLPQAEFFTGALSLPSPPPAPPWLAVKEDAGLMGDTCFPCQWRWRADAGWQWASVSIGTDFCSHHRLAHQVPGEGTSLSHPAQHRPPVLPDVICKGATP